MVVVPRRHESGIRMIVPDEIADQRIGIARLGGAEGRWPETIVEMACGLASKTPPTVGPNEWVRLLDESAAEFEQRRLAWARARRGVGKRVTKAR